MSNNSPKTLSLKQNMIWNSSGNFLYGISQWLLVVIVTRLGGYADAGVLSLAIAIVAVFYTIGLYGMRIFQATDVGFIYRDGDYVSSRVITSLLSILICAAFVFSSGYSKDKAYV
jgi:O-antigen/teichoic acid export membrane protein